MRAASSDERLLLFVTAERFIDRARERAMAITGLPAHAVRVHAVAEFPRTASGKPDTAALVRYAAELEAAQAGVSRGDGVTPETIRALYAELLGRPDAEAERLLRGPRRRLAELRRGVAAARGAARRAAARVAVDVGAPSSPSWRIRPGPRHPSQPKALRHRRRPRPTDPPPAGRWRHPSRQHRPSPGPPASAGGCPRRDPGRAARAGDRAHRRHPRQSLRPEGRRPPAAGGRRVQPRPIPARGCRGPQPIARHPEEHRAARRAGA